MVSFELKEDNVFVAVYWYYPEEDKENYGVLLKKGKAIWY